MAEINLLDSTPKIKRKFDSDWRTDTNREIAKKFGREFFDGERVNGYGGYYYDGRWITIAKKIRNIYDVQPGDSILDVGCAKGFLLYDLLETIPGIFVAGLDISKYAVNHAMDGFGKYMVHNDPGYVDSTPCLEDLAKKKVLPFMVVGSADNLPYADNSFDVVLNINTSHNLPFNLCKKSIEEMLRVGRNPKKMFIQVDAYRGEEQRKLMETWNLTGQTILHVDEWLALFRQIGYVGDYYWTIFNPEDTK